ncbi:DUF4261 domain-containing protein [Loktanella sp. S4079]|uniref:DUF4261 domain-containing protein n=1 Tax=Loktanella sp. S4079 TaxID=579483 RepID=UPI0005FA21D7|nr:DUF4261 domain-containing protein [Loktanella sp. S4079]KJZ21185.1 hypothetical protein TW80_00600 [Loktanella sp. S4079]
MSGTKTDGKVGFSVDLLFSEPLQFDIAEIIEAVNEDYPSCQIADPGFNPHPRVNTGAVALAIFKPREPHDGVDIKMIGAGFPDENFRHADHTETFWRSRGFGQEELARHQSYISVSVDAVDDSLASRFRAARLLNVVTAVFAKLPITLAIYCKWTGHFVSPSEWIAAADQAIKGDWPLTAWVSYRAAWAMPPGPDQKIATGYTTGVSQFMPFELQMEAAPLDPSEVLPMLASSVWMALQGGSKLNDGDTIGAEGGIRYRIRKRENTAGDGPDLVVLLHPDSPIDELKEFGPRPGIPTPAAGPFLKPPKKGFMRRLLGRN